MGEGNTNDEEAMGKHGFGRSNLEGQTVVDFAKRWELIVSNTMFVKRSMQKITYSSGGNNNTQVDYILVRRRRMKEVWDTKVITGESVAKQHRLVVSKNGHVDKVEEDNKTREKNEMVEAERKGDTKPVQGEGTRERDHGE